MNTPSNDIFTPESQTSVFTVRPSDKGDDGNSTPDSIVKNFSVTASQKDRMEAIKEELDSLKVKHDIYSKMPELSGKAKDYKERISLLQKHLVGMAKDFKAASAADNIHATQGSGAGVSKAFSDILDSKSK